MPVSDGPGLSDYLQSPYIIEVGIALLLGIALFFLIRRGRRVDWPPKNGWRGFLVIAGWTLTVVAVVIWILLVWITVNAWIDSMNPALPKKPSLIFLFLGGIVYFAIAGAAGTCFEASSGSARRDVMRKIGRADD